jgi:hypothetical protein
MTVDEINELSALVAKYTRSDVLEALEQLRRVEARREADRCAQWEGLGVDPGTETLTRWQHERILKATVEHRAGELITKMAEQLLEKPKET